MPCYKLGIKFGRADIIKRFHQSGRTGFYLAVLEEGEVGEGDELELIKRDERNVTVSDINRLYFGDEEDTETLRRAMQIEALPASWKKRFRSD
jgi:MOSC domain-containing protein YiiM